MPAVTYAAIRDPFISPAHHTKRERWSLPEGPYTKGGLLRHVAIFSIRSQWQGPEIRFVVIRVYYEKLGQLLKPKFRRDVFARLKNIAEKRVPRR